MKKSKINLKQSKVAQINEVMIKRSERLQVFFRIRVLKNFTDFTGKNLQRSAFFSKYDKKNQLNKRE